MSYVMSNEHANMLKRVCGLKEHEPVPEIVETTYWHFKRQMDKLGAQVSVSDLVWLVIDSGYYIPGEAARTFLDEIRDMNLQWGCPVEVKWRQSKWVPGEYRGVNGGKVIVILEDGTLEEREVPPERVRIRVVTETPEPAETE